MEDDRDPWVGAMPPPPRGEPPASMAPPSASPPPPPAPTPPVQSAWATPGAGGPDDHGWGAASPSAQVGWERPSGGSNGCLKGCLIVGGILVAVALAGIVALVVAVGQLGRQLAENPEAVLGPECPFVSSQEIADAIGADSATYELQGLPDQTIGRFLDDRLLPDAPDCWTVGEDGIAGRIAVDDGGGQAAYAAAHAAADGRFLLTDLHDVGDEAFCTDLDRAGSSGVLVRFGERVVYVSLLVPSGDAYEGCVRARMIARLLEP